MDDPEEMFPVACEVSWVVTGSEQGDDESELIRLCSDVGSLSVLS